MVPLPIPQRIQMIGEEDDQVSTDIGESLDRFKRKVKPVGIEEHQRQCPCGYGAYNLVDLLVCVTVEYLGADVESMESLYQGLVFPLVLLT